MISEARPDRDKIGSETITSRWSVDADIQAVAVSNGRESKLFIWLVEGKTTDGYIRLFRKVYFSQVVLCTRTGSVYAWEAQ